MRAVIVTEEGGKAGLALGEAAVPAFGADGLLVRVKATAVNRADLMQKRGLYPPPPGASDILGLEMAGVVEAAGERAGEWKPGDRVFALLPGGGYAEYAAIPASMAMRIPDALSFEEAAAIPEVFLTAYLNLFRLGGMTAGTTVLVHAGASGVGTAAIQLAREAGATVYATAGSDAKIALCREFGASSCWNYRNGSFAPWIAEQTSGRGVDLILDMVGASYFSDNIGSLATDGRMVVIGLMGGASVDGMNLGMLLSKRLQLIGSALRSRSAEEKAILKDAFLEFAAARLADGRLRPVIDRVMDWSEAEEAHGIMERNRNAGKIVLRVT